MRKKVPSLTTLLQHSFLRNVATMATGAAAAQGITIIFMPVITRLFGPETFGLQGVFGSVVSVAASFAGLAYPIAIILPKSDHDAISLAKLAIYISATTCSLMLLALWLFGKPLLELLNSQLLEGMELLIPLAVFFMTLGTIVNQLLIRKNAYRLNANSTVANTLLLNLTKTIFGWFYPTALVLILTNTLGYLSGAALAWLGWRRTQLTEEATASSGQKKTSVIEMAKNHLEFPLLRMPQNLIVVLSQSLPILLLSGFFGSAIAGQYTIAATALTAPFFLLGSAVNSVFYPRIVKTIQNGGDARAPLLKAVLGMAVTGALPCGIVLIMGPYLFPFVFGEQWQLAGRYAQFLAPWIFLQYVYFPVLAAQAPLKLQVNFLIVEIFGLICKVLALWIGYVFFKSNYWSIGLFSAAGTATCLYLVIWTIYRSGHHNCTPIRKA